jgi:hypothetical protein
MWDIAGVALKNNYNITHIQVDLFKSAGYREAVLLYSPFDYGGITPYVSRQIAPFVVRQVTPSCRATSYSL